MRVILAILLMLIAPAAAHEAPSGWQYPMECCHDADCAPIDTIEQVADGGLKITTKHGTAVFPKSHPRKDSPDGRGHACFTKTNLYCLFLSAGI